jgi:hypothetical protein
MIRSIDPDAHIESNIINTHFILADHSVVSNLIRFINEFWFVKETSISQNENIALIEEEIKKNTSFVNTSSSLDSLIKKVIFYDDVASLFNYVLDNKTKEK